MHSKQLIKTPKTLSRSLTPSQNFKKIVFIYSQMTCIKTLDKATSLSENDTTPKKMFNSLSFLNSLRCVVGQERIKQKHQP